MSIELREAFRQYLNELHGMVNGGENYGDYLYLRKNERFEEKLLATLECKDKSFLNYCTIRHIKVGE